MASIEKRETKKGISYIITVSNGYSVSGKKLREKAVFNPNPNQTPKQQQRDLEKFVLEFESRVKNGKCYSGEKITFYDFTVKWLKEYANNQLEATTVSSYVATLDKHIIPEIGHLKLSEIKPLHLQEFYNKLLKEGNGEKGGYAPSTVKRLHAVISSILATAYEWQMIEYNPCDRVKLPKSNTSEKIKYFTFEQAETFLNALELEYSADYKAHTRTLKSGKQSSVPSYKAKRTIPTQLKVLFNMALFGGFRRGELIALTWDRINLKNNTVEVVSSTGYANNKMYNKAPKTKGSIRLVTLPKSVIDMLKIYRREQLEQRFLLGEKWNGDNWVFTKWNGEQMNLFTPSQAFTNIINKYNSTVTDESEKLPLIGFHGLRHTHATLLVSTNTDIKTISARLGHANTSTTLNIYAHSLQKQDETCANVLDDMFKPKETEVKQAN
jgi:integrase